MHYVSFIRKIVMKKTMETNNRFCWFFVGFFLQPQTVCGIEKVLVGGVFTDLKLKFDGVPICFCGYVSEICGIDGRWTEYLYVALLPIVSHVPKKRTVIDCWDRSSLLVIVAIDVDRRLSKVCHNKKNEQPKKPRAPGLPLWTI